MTAPNIVIVASPQTATTRAAVALLMKLFMIGSFGDPAVANDSLCLSPMSVLAPSRASAQVAANE